MALPKRPLDPAEMAHLVGQMATGEIPNDKDQALAPPRPPHSNGGIVRAAKLTPERRRDIARKAAAARHRGR